LLNRIIDWPGAPSLSRRKGRELLLSGPAQIDLMQAVLARGRSFRFRARGWSMTPFIRDGDVITVAPVNPPDRNPHISASSSRSAASGTEARKCDIGQIVAFVSAPGRRLVVHRIIGRHKSGFLVRGDNLPGPVAETVRPDDILARVVRVERGRKRVWLGLGLERYAIAALSRAGLLLPMRTRVAGLRRLFRRRLRATN
jgi:hypothetical protein